MASVTLPYISASFVLSLVIIVINGVVSCRLATDVFAYFPREGIFLEPIGRLNYFVKEVT